MITHFKHFFPNWQSVAFVIVSVPAIYYSIDWLNTQFPPDQRPVVALIDLAGWWRYLVYALLAMCGMYYLARMDPAKDKMANFVRSIGAVGLLCYLWAPANPALAVLASGLVLLSFVFGLRQISMMFIEHRKRLLAPYKIPWGLRFLVALVAQDQRHPANRPNAVPPL